MKHLLLIIFLFPSFLGNAQSTYKIDSLKKVLAGLSVEGKSFSGDTLRVRVLCALADNETDPKKSHEHLTVAKFIADKQNDKQGQLLALDKFSKLYSYQPVRVIEYYMKGLAIAENIQDYEKIILYTNRIRSKYFNLGDNKNAMKYALYNLKTNNKHGNLEAQLLSMNNIGIIFFQMKNYDKALNYFTHIHRLNSNLKSSKIESTYLINSAKIYVVRNQNQKALINLQKVLKINDGFKDTKSYVANEIALIYLSKNQIKEALHYAKISENAVQGLSDNHQISVFNTLKKIYQKNGDIQNYAEYLERFTVLSLKEDSIKNVRLTDFINLDYISEKQLIEIHDLNTDIREKEFKNKLLIGGILTTAIILIVFLFFYGAIKKKNQEINEQSQKIEDLNKSLEFKVVERTFELLEANKELIKKNFEISEALFKGKTIERKRVAAELHDNLGSTLAALNWRLDALDSNNLEEDERVIYESIKSMMNNAYNDIRNLSHNLLPTELSERGLIGAIKKLRNDLNSLNKLNVTFSYTGNVEHLKDSIAFELYSICLELVNNALKYSNANQININLSEQNNKILFSIEDDGIGLEKIKEGMGLTNIRNRVESVNGDLQVLKYRKGCEFRIMLDL